MGYRNLVILAASWFGWAAAEMAQEIELDRNVTEQKVNAQGFFKFNLEKTLKHTGQPLIIVTTILGIALVKPLILKIKMAPPSIVLLCFGVLFSVIVQGLPENVMPEMFHFHEEIFFVVYLPFIIADAGWFLPMKEFFHNIGQISLYAVVGTLCNSLLTVGFLYLCQGAFSTSGISVMSLTVFSVIISAVDPVAVISVFEDVQVNERLNILVFGESLLNDGVVIVLYTSLTSMLTASYGEEGAIGIGSYFLVIGSFCSVVGFGILFGAVFGIVGVLLQRLCVAHQALMPTISLGFPYLSYLAADTFGFSGLVAILTCCIVMKNFVSGNVCLEMQYTTEFVFKNLGSYSEAFIFILLGVASGRLIRLPLDIPFIILTLVGIILIRFFVIFGLTGITNSFKHFKEDKIAYRDQFIMAYGGLRGAVCYGLIASLDHNLVKEKDLYTSAIIASVAFTTIVQGCTIRCFVQYLSVKTKEEKTNKKSSLQHAMLMSAKHLTHFVEDLTQNHEENAVFRWVRTFDIKMRRFICYYQKPKGIALLEDQAEEETFYRKGTSFAGLPTDHSLASMHLPTSKSELFAMGYHESALMPPKGPKPSVPRLVLPPSSPIPRNESVSNILPAIYENEYMDRESLKTKRKSIYNRHVLGYGAPADPTTSTDRPEEEEEDDTACQMTFPYAKNLNQKLLAQQARNISKSVKDKSRLRFVSPHRAGTTKEAEHHYKTYHASTANSKPRLTIAPPRFTITDEESPSPPNQSRAGRARNERKIHTSTKTFVVGGEDIDLLPIHEDEDSH